MSPAHHHDDDEDHLKGPKVAPKKKPKFGAVKGIKPDSKGVNVVVKAIKCTDTDQDGICEATCGDTSGCVILRLRGEEQKKLVSAAAESGGTLRIQNGRVAMFK